MSETTVADPPQPTTLLDLEGELLNANFVDENQPLFIPSLPLHWKAHKLQVLLARLDKQAANIRNGSSFNSQSYLQILNEYVKTIDQIKAGKTKDDTNDSGEMGNSGTNAQKAAMGQRDASGLDSGVSADNPFAR